MSWRVLIFVVCVGLGGIWPAASVGENVVVVELRTLAAEKQVQELEELISIELGRPLDAREVKRTVRNLHASGVASEVEVLVERRDVGLAVIVVLYPLPRVDEVRLVGELGEGRQLVQRELFVRPGNRLVEGDLLRSVYGLQDFYRDRGYREARVRLEVESLGGERFDVDFQIDSGPRFSFGRIEVEGAPADADPLGERRLLESRHGKPYLRSKIVEDRKRLEAFLFDRGYLSALVGQALETLNEERQAIDVLFEVSPGPRFEIEILGARRQDLERKGLLPFLGEAGFDEALVLQAVTRIKRHYQAKGHYRADVEFTEERGPEEVHLKMEVTPGAVFSLGRVALVGNEQVPDSVLRKLMTTAPRTWVVPGSGRLVDDTLAADLENLRSYYRLQGFSEIALGPADIVEQGDSLSVEIPIVEGERRRVVSVSVEGAGDFDPDELVSHLPLQAGGPFHQRLVEDSRAILRSRYLQLGYSDVQIVESADWDADHQLVDLVFEIDEGWRSELERLVIRGNGKTRTEVVRRSLGLEIGDPVSSQRLLEAQRNLYRLGLFSRVDIDLMSTPDDPARHDLLVRLQEAPPRRVTYGFGYNSEEGLGGLLGWSHGNVFGRAHSLTAEARVTTSENHRFRLLYRQPTFGGWLLPMQYMVFRFDEDRPGYEVSSFGSQIVASWLHRRLRWGARYDYRIVQPFNITVPINEIERELQESRIASGTVFLHFDTRDSAVDARSGSSTRFEVELARPWLSATAEYLKVFAEQSLHFDFHSWGVLVASFRLGGIEPLADLEQDEDDAFPPLPTASIPIVERFFGGGRTTHRAYERDLLGIVGRTLNNEGEPTGGNGLLLANVDYRFPIAGPVEGLVFLDAGNVWADWRDFDHEDLRFGAGIGARYMSPIGPLRLEMGWKLDKRPGEAGSAVFLSFGDPF